MLVAAMNPCPCGNFYEEAGKCKCSSSALMKYRGRISGPLLDRIDIQLIVRSVRSGDLVFSDSGTEEPSKVIAERVRKARQIQMDRYMANGERFFTNAAITPSRLADYCRLSSMDRRLVETFVSRHGVSARGYTRILKIARTVADLDGEERINAAHLSEAFNLRCPDKNEMMI